MTALSRFGLALSLSVVAGTAAHATTLAQLSVDQMTDASDLVVRGTVASVVTDLDEHGHVVTLAEIEVAESLKGGVDAGDWVTVESHGGIYGDLLVDTPAAARYAVGEDVVVFLSEKRGGTAYGTVGMFLGKYTVKKEPVTGRNMVVRFTLPYDQEYDARFVPNPPKGQRVMLEELDTQVRARVALGWDGQPIPGISDDHLRRINRVQPGVK